MGRPARKGKLDPLVALHEGLSDADKFSAEIDAAARSDAIRAKPARRRVTRIGQEQTGTVRIHGRRWRLQFRGERDANGRRKQHSITLGERTEMDYEQAREHATRLMRQLAPRRAAIGATWPWPEWVKRVLEVYLPNRKRGTRRTLGSIIRVHLEPAFRRYQVHEIRVALVQNWIAQMHARGASPATIRVRYRVLHWMLRRARAEGIMVEVLRPGDIDLPRGDSPHNRRQVRAFTTEQVARIIAISQEPWRTLWMLLALCGLRIGEGLAVRRSDLDLEAGRLFVARQAAGGREVAPKTETSVAERRIPPTLLAHLQEFCAGIGADELLFPSPHGGVFDDSGVRRYHLRPILEQLGIAGLSSHGFRHWYGSTGAQAGVALVTLQRAMRHGDVRSTQVYISVSTEAVDRAIDTIESCYSQAAAELGAKRNEVEPGESSGTSES